MKFFAATTLALIAMPLVFLSTSQALPVQREINSAPMAIIQVDAIRHKMRSAGFLAVRLEKKGVVIESVHREGQVYLFLITVDGTKAIVAIDGYSSEIIGVNVLVYGAGVTERAVNSAGVHFIDFTYEFGYVVEETTYQSYTEITTEEISSTEEYTEVSYEESEEVSYSEITYDETTSTEEEQVADLDQGEAGDEAGDTEADIQDNADEAPDEGSSDDEG